MGLQIYSYVLNPVNLLNDNPLMKLRGMVFLVTNIHRAHVGDKRVGKTGRKKRKFRMSKNG